MKYMRELLRGVEGYVPGEQPKASGVVKLNTNENPYPPSPKVMDALGGLGPDALRKYPDPLAVDLRRACAKRHGYPDESWVIAGNGMDELLALALRTFVDPGDTVLSPSPTYTLYETLCALHGARYTPIEVDEHFQLPEEFFAAGGRLCFLPRPNAPTAVSVSRAAIERFCASFSGLVIIDEAYVDFADDHCMDFPKRFENTIVMRTFSKSFSLAGMRLGIGVARPELITEFLKTKDSYNLNAVAQAVGLAAMRDYEHMLANTEKVRATRARTVATLRDMGFEIPEPQANFVLAKWTGTPSARNLFEALRKRNIYVRYFDAPRLRDCLRITIGTDKEMGMLFAALREMI